jgi:hypothetical protein
VIDFNDQPIPHASVSINCYDNAGKLQSFRDVKTNSDGYYTTRVDDSYSVKAEVYKFDEPYIQWYFVQTRLEQTNDGYTMDFKGASSFYSIQAEIDRAQDGDTIIVCPNTYYEVIDFHGKAIRIQSLDPTNPTCVAETIINGVGQNRPVVTFQSGEGSQAQLIGLTIRDGVGEVIEGDTYGGGILIHNSSPYLANNVIESCSATFGGGIYVGGQSAPVLLENRLEQNMAYLNGGGLFLDQGVDATVDGNHFVANQAKLLGGALWVAATVRVHDQNNVTLTIHDPANTYSQNLPDAIFFEQD